MIISSGANQFELEMDCILIIHVSKFLIYFLVFLPCVTLLLFPIDLVWFFGIPMYIVYQWWARICICKHSIQYGLFVKLYLDLDIIYGLYMYLDLDLLVMASEYYIIIKSWSTESVQLSSYAHWLQTYRPLTGNDCYCKSTNMLFAIKWFSHESANKQTDGQRLPSAVSPLRRGP